MDWATIGQSLLKDALSIDTSDDKNKKNTSKQSSWKSFFQRNLIYTSLLTMGLYNSDMIYRKFYYNVPTFGLHDVKIGDHEIPWVNTEPLDTLLKAKLERQDPEHKPVTLSPETLAMIKMVQEPKLVLTSPYLLSVAQAGLVKEIHTPYTDKPIALGITPWNAIMLDGSVVKAEIDAPLRDKLMTELKIPIRHPFSGLNLSLIEASLYAGLIVNGLSSFTSDMKERLKRLMREGEFKPPGPSPKDKKLMEKQEMGRLALAAVLNVEPAPLTLELLEEQMGEIKPNKELKPLTRKELKNRLVVLLAPSAVERILREPVSGSSTADNDSLSVGSSGSFEAVSRIASLMVVRLGMGETFGKYIPSEVKDDDPKAKQVAEEIRQLFEWADKRALELSAQYKDRLEPLLEAVNGLKDLTREEVLLILEGKSKADIQKIRGWSYYVPLPVNLKRKFTKPNSPT